VRLERYYKEAPVLILYLADVSSWPLISYYGGQFPKRMAFVHPDVLGPLRNIAERVVITDLYRDPISSLEARKLGKRGVQRPGWSGHNFGISIDLDIDACLNRKFTEKKTTNKELVSHSRDSFNNYLTFLVWMADNGWTCHRSDGKRGFEDWHFNCLGSRNELTPYSSAGPQRWISDHYADNFNLDEREAQTVLSNLGYYKGSIDGDWGPLSQAAMRAFERSLNLTEDGKLDAVSMRSLAVFTAHKNIIVAPWEEHD